MGRSRSDWRKKVDALEVGESCEIEYDKDAVTLRTQCSQSSPVVKNRIKQHGAYRLQVNHIGGTIYNITRVE